MLPLELLDQVDLKTLKVKYLGANGYCFGTFATFLGEELALVIIWSGDGIVTTDLIPTKLLEPINNIELYLYLANY